TSLVIMSRCPRRPTRPKPFIVRRSTSTYGTVVTAGGNWALRSVSRLSTTVQRSGLVRHPTGPLPQAPGRQREDLMRSSRATGENLVPHPDPSPVLYLIACGGQPARQLPAFVDFAQDQGWDVCVIATPDGMKFVDAEQLADQTGHPVRSQYKQPDEPD